MNLLTYFRQKQSTKLFLFILLSILLLVGGCGYDDNVKVVRNGNFYDYPNIPIGEAFDDFFEDSKWESFTSDDNRIIVDFKGKCLYNDKKANVHMQFTLYNNQSFEVTYSSINDVPINILMHGGLIYKVMDSYEK
ncbi:hypothetical protein [Veillonella intestinalis]|uniref:hypothetical protein n=1 Tax=Veillonella intestinalis TaxID=2941341 RepID=UPI00204010D5|nr:hypothetical protein [Veillonella intestinalis]